MSGISSGSIFFTPVVMTLAAYYTAEHFVKSAAKFMFAGVYAVDKYCKDKEKENIRKLDCNADELSASVSGMLVSQHTKFQESLNEMKESISTAHRKLAESLDENTALTDFSELLSSYERSSMNEINRIHSDFRRQYSESVNRNNSEILTSMTRLKDSIFNELRSLEADTEMKNALASQRASELLTRAKDLAASADAGYVASSLIQADTDISSGNYQSAISISSSVITEIYMNMFKNDSEEREKEYYTVCCIYLISEIRELLNGLKDIQIKKNRDSEDLINMDLTQFMSEEYMEYPDKIDSTEARIMNDQEILTSQELKKAAEDLNSMFTEINESISEAFYLMTYCLNRVDAEKNIYHILMEKGFELCDTLYTDGDPSKACERKYRCRLTGEEVTISLIPFLNEDSEYQTDIVLQSNDVSCSEESRELFRKEIIRRLKEDCRNVDSINIKCHEETRNKNAADIADNTVGISNPQHIKAVLG